VTATLDPAQCAIVVAHPDDEVLWMSSILAQARRVILCFGDTFDNREVSEGRRIAVAEYPLSTVESLDVTEAGVFGRADWPSPETTALGVGFRRDIPGHAARAADYARNSERLVALLRERLAGCPAVVTHNPWGEYGHEEHVQVFRAVEAVRRELGFDLWVTSYYSEKSAALMARCIQGLCATTPRLATDPALGDRLRELYAANDSWTWFDDYAWPTSEVFHLWGGDGAEEARPGVVRPMTCIRLGWAPQRQPSHLRRLIRTLRG
jgi:LmbE family N-acetylglucosaminyl deacetylase